MNQPNNGPCETVLETSIAFDRSASKPAQVSASQADFEQSSLELFAEIKRRYGVSTRGDTERIGCNRAALALLHLEQAGNDVPYQRGAQRLAA
jgi:hypothetical protein